MTSNIVSNHTKKALAIIATVLFFLLTVAFAIPSIVDAAPGATPPGGNVDANFNSVTTVSEIQNSNFRVEEDGDVINPTSNPLKIADNDGVEITTTSGRGSIKWVAHQTQSYLQNIGFVNNSLIGQSIVVRDSQGFGVFNDSSGNFAFGVVPETGGGLDRGIYTNTKLVNSGVENGGAVTIADSDGLSIGTDGSVESLSIDGETGSIVNPKSNCTHFWSPSDSYQGSNFPCPVEINNDGRPLNKPGLKVDGISESDIFYTENGSFITGGRDQMAEGDKTYLRDGFIYTSGDMKAAGDLTIMARTTTQDLTVNNDAAIRNLRVSGDLDITGSHNFKLTSVSKVCSGYFCFCPYPSKLIDNQCIKVIAY